MRVFNIPISIIVSILLFILLLPIVDKIDFMQNDDWAFYQSTQEYIKGNYTINPITIFNKSAPLFYVQGVLGVVFATFFGLSNLPVLTLIISVLNFYILASIFKKFFNKTNIDSLLLSGFIFFNPIYFYSILGFMTENYFIFFLLLFIYFMLRFNSSSKPVYFLISNLFLILGFFVRQFSFIASVSWCVYLLLTKKFKYFFIQLIPTLGMFIGYYVLYMGKNNFQDSGLNYMHLLDTTYLFDLILAILLYISLFFGLLIFLNFKVKNYKYLLPIMIVSLLIFKDFTPLTLYNGEFPYLGNVFERTGFLTRSILGMKGNFYGMFDFYNFLDIISKLFLPITLIFFIKNLKSLNNYFLIFLGVFGSLLLVTINVYDRYLILIFIFTLFLIAPIKLTNIKRLLLTLFLSVFIFLNYQFSMDFIYTKNAIWDTAYDLGVPYSIINAGTAWNKVYKVGNYDYFFSYDKLDKELVKKLEIDYPLSFYVDNSVYFYKVTN